MSNNPDSNRVEKHCDVNTYRVYVRSEYFHISLS